MILDGFYAEPRCSLMGWRFEETRSSLRRKVGVFPHKRRDKEEFTGNHKYLALGLGLRKVTGNMPPCMEQDTGSTCGSETFNLYHHLFNSIFK